MFERGATVAITGSRGLSAPGAERVGSVAEALLEAGHGLAVGCCVGADEAVLRAAVESGRADELAVYCAFGPGGRGSCGVSAAAAVAAAAEAGARVFWWAGGDGSVPLAARLARRTSAVVWAGQGGLLACFGASVSRGALLACREALAVGRPVAALPAGCAAEELPRPEAGSWVRQPRAGVDGLRAWVPDQRRLF